MANYNVKTEIHEIEEITKQYIYKDILEKNFQVKKMSIPEDYIVSVIST